MIGRRTQSLVAVTVALAGMAVLLAAGGAPAQVEQPLQPTDPGEFVPSSLSHHAFALWARSDVDAEQAAETFGTRIDRCRRSVTDPNRLGGCIGRVVNGLHAAGRRCGVERPRAVPGRRRRVGARCASTCTACPPTPPP